MAFGSMAPGGGIGGMGANILKMALGAQQPGAGGAPNPMAGGLIPMLAGGGGPNGLIQRILKMGNPAVNPGAPPPPGDPAYVEGGVGPMAGGMPSAMPPMGLLGKLGGGMQGLAGLFGGGAAGGAPGTW